MPSSAPCPRSSPWRSRSPSRQPIRLSRAGTAAAVEAAAMAGSAEEDLADMRWAAEDIPASGQGWEDPGGAAVRGGAVPGDARRHGPGTDRGGMVVRGGAVIRAGAAGADDIGFRTGRTS